MARKLERIGYSLGVAASILLASPLAASDAASTVTPGFDAFVPETNLAAVTNNVQWYVAIKVSATAPDAQLGSTSAVLTRKRAAGTWAVVKRALGVDNGEDKYSFVLSISAAGVSLPPMTALQLDHVEDGGIFSSQVETVTVSTAQNEYSAWVPIDKSSKLSITIHHIGSSKPNFDLLNQSTSLANEIGTVTGLAVTPPVQAILSQLASGVTNVINGSQVTNDSTLFIDTFPLNGDPAGYSTTMRDVDGNPIAKVTIDLAFRRSLRNGPEFSFRHRISQPRCNSP